MTPGTSRGDGNGSHMDLRDRGFALILVIWVLALLALLGAEVAADSRSAVVVSRNRLDLAQLQASADAGVTLAVMGLLDPVVTARWQADNRVYDRQYAGQRLAIAVADEGGKIDVNVAPIELIAGLLNEFGVDRNQQALITQAILERRTQFVPATPTPTASANTGRIFGQSHVINLANLAFADVSELRLLPGMTRALYTRLEPEITVYSQNPTVNPMTASRQTLLAIPGTGPGDADAVMASRGGVAAQLDAAELSKLALYARVDTLHVVSITARAGLPDGASFTRRAVVSLSPDRPLEPTRILRWEQPPDLSAADEVSLR
jgi:general secretion pathway protein K